MTDKTQPHAGSTHIIRYALELGLLWIDGDGRDKVREALDALDALEAQLDSIGAGGASVPLIGRAADHFEDKLDMVARWYMVDKDGMATLCTDMEDAEQEAKDANMAWPHTAPHRAVQLVEVGTSAAELHHSPPEGMVGGWISVEDRLPEWAARDDTPCFINGKEVPPTLTSETVLVALKGGGIRTDKLTTIEGKSDGWWHTYGERVVAWQKTPAPPASEAKGE